jgi:MFS family permease
MDTPPIKQNTRQIKLILSIEGISSLVNQFFQILLPWYILISTGSIMWMGVAAFATLVPGIFSALWGGAVIDRVGRSKTMLICELSQLIIITTITVLVVYGKA